MVGSGRATKPWIMPRGHDIGLRLTQDGGTDVSVDPSTLTSQFVGSYGPPDWGEYRGDLGALWMYDWPSGTVNRQEFANGPIRTIRVTESQPYSAGRAVPHLDHGRLGKSLGDGGRSTPNGGPCVR